MKIGVLCSGGDAPGMNPCLRAIVRAGKRHDDFVVGIKHGYQGIFNEEFWGDSDGCIGARDVSGMTNRGGSVLNSSRCQEMMKPDGPRRAAEILTKHKFDALIAIGGNGTLTGANEIAKIWDGQVIGLPGTIDNDLCGTDFTIGFATAVYTVVDAIDKLRDTAGSHDMMFVVETMGRHCGDLAAVSALAGGCELVAVPEKRTDICELVAKLKRFKELGKRSIIMVVAEGDDFGNAQDIMKALKENGAPYEMRSVVLGHIQRGGAPVPGDRVLATRLGVRAVEELHNGQTGVMIGEVNIKIVLTPLEEVISGRRQMAEYVAELIDSVSV